MEKIKLFIILLFTSVISLGNCSNADEKSDPDCVFCDEKEIIKVIENASAHVRKHTYSTGQIAYYLELVNADDDLWSSSIFPCNDIFKEYKTENIIVYISGNITNCLMSFGEPNIDYKPINIIELISIKTNLQ
jgi:hypothetical protein